MKGIELQEDGQISRIKVIGAIDNTTQFPDRLKNSAVVVDLERLTIFSSMGIRVWLTWLRNGKTIKQLSLENCRPSFIKQSSYIPDVIPTTAHVVSFYVPYFDPSNNETTEIKMVRGEDFDDRGLKEKTVKSSGGGILELDVDDRYFDFLKRRSS